MVPFGLMACYTQTSKPDYIFMNMIKQQSTLDSNKRTTIEINPKKFYFGNLKSGDKLKGFFYIRNTGNLDFNLLAIRPDCACVKISPVITAIVPGDSLKINYELDLTSELGLISHSIVVIGNCSFGNQTFFMEGIINNH